MKIKIKNTEQMLSLKLSVYIIRNHMLKWLVGLLTRKNSHVWSLDLILLALCLLIVDKKKKKKIGMVHKVLKYSIRQSVWENSRKSTCGDIPEYNLLD